LAVQTISAAATCKENVRRVKAKAAHERPASPARRNDRGPLWGCALLGRLRCFRCSVSGQLLGDLAICFRLRTRGFNYAGGLAGFARLTGSQSGGLLLHDGGIIGPWPSSKLLQRGLGARRQR
jgi:hypothetical protein